MWPIEGTSTLLSPCDPELLVVPLSPCLPGSAGDFCFFEDSLNLKSRNEDNKSCYQIHRSSLH